MQPRLGVGLRRARQRQGHDPRRLGHLHGHGLHQLERAVRGSDASGQGFRRRCSRRTTPNGHRNPDGRFYQVGQPLTNIQSLNAGRGRSAAAVRAVGGLRGSRSRKRSRRVGWSHELNTDTVVNGGLRAHRRPRAERPAAPEHAHQRRPPAFRRSAAVARHRRRARGRRSAAASASYDALILGVRRRLSHGIDFTGSYTLSNGNSTIGTRRRARYQLTSRTPSIRSTIRAVRAKPPDRRATPHHSERHACRCRGTSRSRRSGSSARRCRSTSSRVSI